MITKSRKQSRIYALQTLFAYEFHKDEEAIVTARDESNQNADTKYAEEMIQGVRANQDFLDATIQTYSPKRKLSRFAKVDRAILRLAVWELLYTELDPKIIISEAVRIAKDYSSDTAYKTINAILANVAKSHGSVEA